MNPERVKNLSEGLRNSWAEIQELASQCFGFSLVEKTLSGLVEMKNGRPKHVGFFTELERTERYAKKAKGKVIKKIKEGVETCNRYMREAPHPNILVASGFLIRGLQICKERNGCGDVGSCPLLEYMEDISFDI